MNESLQPFTPSALESLVGREARVTGTVKAGLTGEVIIDGHAYHALPENSLNVYVKGERVQVLEHDGSRTVYVGSIPPQGTSRVPTA